MLIFITGLGIFWIDLFTKARFFPNKIDATTSNWIQLTHHQNTGLLFDLPFPRAMILAISLAVFIGLFGSLWNAIRHQKQSQAFALALILGGALGNLFDRWTLGFVRDWLLLFGRSALNLGDIAIGLGLLWYLFGVRSRLSGVRSGT